jgi:hypothetical protein
MTRRFFVPLVALILTCAAVSAHGASASPDVQTQDLTLYIGEQQAFTPGYAIGDIQVLNPEIANYRVQPGRREVMLVGKGKGETALIIWDQKRVKRHEIKLVVHSHDEMRAETDLKALLQDFPGIQIRHLGDRLVLSGTVASQADFDAIGRIANVASAENLVRLVHGPYAGSPAAASTSPTSTSTGTGTSSPATSASTASTPTAAPLIEYEVEVIEGNVAFQSGTYGKGIEPSGPTLFKQVVRAPLGGDVDLLVPGASVTSKNGDKNKGAVPLNLKLRLKPAGISEDGQLTTTIAIETNLPVEGAKDPRVNRRARWELVGATDEPFGLAGAELMAMPQVAQNPSRLGRVLSTATQTTGMPGMNGLPGTTYVPSYVPYYDKSKHTQLIAVIRPRLITPVAK